jgi:hypothetical protein
LVNGDRVGGSAEREDRSVFGQIRHVVAEAARSESEKRAAKSREAEVIVQGIATPAAEDFRPEPGPAAVSLGIFELFAYLTDCFALPRHFERCQEPPVMTRNAAVGRTFMECIVLLV